jgi:D-3-phosphoglycerate dehydrogenase
MGAADGFSVLLLEGVNPAAAEFLRRGAKGRVESLPTALSEADLVARLPGVQLLGIRSRTKLTRRALEAATDLLGVGCFCIGTDQVDLPAAQERAVPVFNAPFASTRSVAELALGAAIALLRGVPRKSAAARRGQWLKSFRRCHEARGKNLGIVGYGNIGSQLGVLAGALGMNVLYYDIEKKLSHGNARPVRSLDELLESSDVVTLHVPETPATRGMIDARALSRMKPGAMLINYARGTVVDVPALVEALRSGQVGGAALDVFPAEPRSDEEEFVSPLREFENVLLTPHIGGSTEEAQQGIGVEVAEKLVRYVENGSTMTAVNFPQVALPEQVGAHRILNVHRNVPGMLSQINQVFSSAGANILGQFLQTNERIGYVVLDIDRAHDPRPLGERLSRIEGSLRTRILH